MALENNHRLALNRLTWLPIREATELRNEAMNQAINDPVAEMAYDLQEIPGIGRQTALDILFALALALNGETEWIPKPEKS